MYQCTQVIDKENNYVLVATEQLYGETGVMDFGLNKSRISLATEDEEEELAQT